MLVLHFIGLTMGLGTGFSHAFLGIAVAKMPADEVNKFHLNTLVLSIMGHIGISLLLISGLYLVTPYWKILFSSPLLMIKLSLVIMLLVLITFINLNAKKAKKGDVAALNKIAQLGKFTLITGITIVIIAVVFFK